MADKSPKLRTVSKSLPPFPLNKFPKDFPYLLGKELIYLLATKGRPSLQGEDWEQIFANCIGAEWKPSNVGLDDIIMGNTAWGAKSVKGTNISKGKKIRLISGRNSTMFSFEKTTDIYSAPNKAGELVLKIWNGRVESVREKFQNLRMVVLVKSNDLTEVVVFEFDTIRYDPELYRWQWNKNNNLEGIEKETGKKRFTWQRHGAQFTIHETIPSEYLKIKIMKPPTLNKNSILSALKVDDKWITVTHNG